MNFAGSGVEDGVARAGGMEAGGAEVEAGSWGRVGGKVAINGGENCV